ncbi:mitotic spindle assembly checkpoint protein 1 [Cavenderia fasciculata]|uniref:Mitotic spindle assembly checkpoint protein 1 n=1 Tax=Cavenderia fasciculata TaxID=261658 RepID=F4QB19_CACFS|nr:mitotic spindle assembly checkpoint protein 1 [Cavenderia fasciculata]EGG14791.1 mitotic spindle assembly checkpoint protein 1 [Cavenderia fasciculata]|eukprot:XP_004351307.1 mitotic spindle assembly checkpoint protein 1 [Cavenderia fasciculata]
MFTTSVNSNHSNDSSGNGTTTTSLLSSTTTVTGSSLSSGILDDGDNEQMLQQQFEYIEKLEGDVGRLQKDNESLNDKSDKHADTILSLEKELAIQRSRVYELERQNSNFQTATKEAYIEKEEKEKELEMRLASKNKELDELLINIRYMSKNEQEAKKKYDDLLEKTQQEQRNNDMKIKSLEKEKLRYRSDVANLKHKNSFGLEMEASSDSKDLVIESLESKNQSLVQENTSIKNRLDQTIKDLVEAEKLIEIFQQQILSKQKQDQSQSQLQHQQQLNEQESIKKSLQREVTYYSEINQKNQSKLMELENQLKGVGNSEMIKQENKTLKDKLSRFEETITKLNSLQVQYNTMAEEKQSLEKIYGQIDSQNGGLESFHQKIRELESENQTLRGKIGELTSNLKLSESHNNDIETLLKESKESCNLLHTKISNQDESINRLNKQVYLLKKERDGIKRILDAFDVEDRVVIKKENENGGGSGGDSSPSTVSLAQKMERINELERAVLEKDRLIEEYETTLSMRNSILDQKDDSINYKLEFEKLNQEIERLLQDNAILESRLGRGEFDQTKTKVLHMTNNPTSMLLNQNQSNHQPNSISESKLLEENNGLRIQISENDKKMDRLKQVFKLKIHEFREAVYALFGFKIDMDTNNLYKLQSMYAEKESDFLIFQRAQSSSLSNDKKVGRMELMETEFTNTLDKEVRAYLFKCKCIPAFLSQITIDLFSKQTFHP